MKKVFSAAICAALIGWAGSASAAPMTWTDNIETDQYINYYGEYSYTHDITDGAGGFEGLFMAGDGDDIAFFYSLSIGLKDDPYNRWDFLEWVIPETAFVDQPGVLGDGNYNFAYTNQDFGISLAGLLQINTEGQLDVSIRSRGGDFTFDYSRLTVRGDNGGAPVPEPTTMLLFGTGLLGLAAIGRRRN